MSEINLAEEKQFLSGQSLRYQIPSLFMDNYSEATKSRDGLIIVWMMTRTKWFSDVDCHVPRALWDESWQNSGVLTKLRCK